MSSEIGPLSFFLSKNILELTCFCDSYGNCCGHYRSWGLGPIDLFLTKSLIQFGWSAISCSNDSAEPSRNFVSIFNSALSLVYILPLFDVWIQTGVLYFVGGYSSGIHFKSTISFARNLQYVAVEIYNISFLCLIFIQFLVISMTTTSYNLLY